MSKHTQPPHRPTALGYVRVSTEEQARDGISLDAQAAKISAYAEAKDLELRNIIRDEGVRGKDLKRDGIEQIVRACQAQEVGAVIVVKLDRLSRRTRDLLYLVEDVFQAHDIDLHSLQETVDTSSASGRFFLRIMGALAEMERELIGERTAAALAHLQANGQRLGAVPLGFRPDGPGGDLLPDSDELVVVENLLALWRRGWSYRRIAAHLNAEGANTKRGGRWHPSTVAKVVRRRARYAAVLGAV